jgi:hypothetical protein
MSEQHGEKMRFKNVQNRIMDLPQGTPRGRPCQVINTVCLLVALSPAVVRAVFLLGLLILEAVDAIF